MHYPPQRVHPAGKPTAAGQVAVALAQLALLGIATVVVIVAFLVAAVETRRFSKAEEDNAQLARVDEERFEREAAQTAAGAATFRSGAADWENTLQQFAARGKPAQAAQVAETAAVLDVKDDGLVQRLQDATKRIEPADIQTIYGLAKDDPRRADISSALVKHARAISTPLDQLAAIATATSDARLGAAIVEAYEQHPELLKGAAAFQAIRGLGARWRDPRTPALALQCVDKSMMRQNDFPDSTMMHRYGEAFSILAPLNAELLAQHAGQDTPAGDVVRGALFRLSNWPAPVVQELKKAFQEASELFEIALTQWVSDMPPPVEVRDALFETALARVSRKAVGNVRKDLAGTALLPELTTANTVDELMKTIVRLESANPAAARALALRAMRFHPRAASTALAKAAQAGNAVPPPLISDPWWAALQAEARLRGGTFLPPVLTNERWAKDIDAALAPVLADGQPSPGLVAVAADWGGPLSAAILEKAAENARGNEAESLRAAAQKIKSRALPAGEAN
jgi:hypothetical protein